MVSPLALLHGGNDSKLVLPEEEKGTPFRKKVEESEL
jgi:hypothetical protein